MSTTSPRRAFFPLVFLACSILFVLSCKSDASKTASGNAPAHTGSSLSIRLEASVTGLNPLMSMTGYNRHVLEMVFMGLGTFEPTTIEQLPYLAKTIPAVYTVADGPYKGKLAYDFEIETSAVWDNGQPVIANDFLFSLKTIFHPLLPYENWKGYFEYLHDVAPDPTNPKKFTVYFDQYYILGIESLCQFPIFPAYQYDPNGALKAVPLKDLMDPAKSKALAKDPAQEAFAKNYLDPKFTSDVAAISACGPYRVERLNGDQGVVLVKKAGWWGDKLVPGKPQMAAIPDTLDYRVVKDEPTVENMLKSGDLDLALSVAPAKFLEWKNDAFLKERFDFSTTPTTNFSKVVFNLRTPKLQDRRVRQALAQAVDYDFLLNSIYKGIAQRTVANVSPNASYYATSVPLYTNNPEAARNLLAQAGWADSNNDGIVDRKSGGKTQNFTLDLLIPMSATQAQVAASIVESMRRIGVEVKVETVDVGVLGKRTIEGQYEAALLTNALYPGLTDFYQQYHSASLSPKGDNRARFSNPEADRLFEQIRTTPDAETRKNLYLQAQQLLHDEVPEIPLVFSQQRCIVNKHFNPVFSIRFPNYFENLFTEKKVN